MNLLLFALLSLTPSPAEVQTLWSKGNEAYTAGHYDEALSHYEAAYENLQKRGMDSGELQFNLANTYLKNDQLGRAILHFCRARKLLPGDKEVETNLAFADKRRQDPPIEGENQAFDQVFDRYARLVDYGTLYHLALALLVLGGLASLVLIARPGSGKWLGYVLVIGCTGGILLTGGLFLQHKQLTREDLAVVVRSQADVHAGPAMRESVSFTIHEGIRCRVLDDIEGWYHISLANGYNGWIERTAVEKI